MKASAAHEVPLTPRLLEILAGLPREEGNPHVFVGARGGTSVHKMTALRALNALRPGVTVHGFRSTFTDWAHETTNATNELIEMCLAHSVGSSTTRAYRRTRLFDKRRELMEQWEAFCLGRAPTQMDRAAVVVPFPSAS